MPITYSNIRKSNFTTTFGFTFSYSTYTYIHLSGGLSPKNNILMSDLTADINNLIVRLLNKITVV